MRQCRDDSDIVARGYHPVEVASRRKIRTDLAAHEAFPTYLTPTKGPLAPKSGVAIPEIVVTGSRFVDTLCAVNILPQRNPATVILVPLIMDFGPEP